MAEYGEARPILLLRSNCCSVYRMPTLIFMTDFCGARLVHPAPTLKHFENLTGGKEFILQVQRIDNGDSIEICI